MANAYSIPTQYKQYESEWDTQLLATALTYKQQTYDVNRQKFQNFINEFSQIDLVKTEDQEHFYNNLKMLKNEVDAYGMGDLSQSGVADNLASYVSQAADDKVVNGYAGTLQFRKYQAKWDKIKEESPELYSEDNYQYGLLNFNNWASDGKTGSSLNSYKNPYIGAGIGEVNPYVNVMDIAQDIVKTIEPDTYVKLSPMGNFTYYKESGEEVTDERVINSLNVALLNDPQVANQMKINSWSKFRGIDDATFTKAVSDNYGTMLEKYDSRILELERKQLTKSGNEVTALQSDIDALKAKKNEIVKLNNPNDIQKNRPSLEYQLYTDELFTSLADVYAYTKVKDKNFITDQGALSVWKENNAQQRHNDEMALKEKIANQDNLSKIATELNLRGEDAANILATSMGYPPETVTSLILSNNKITDASVDAPNSLNLVLDKVNEDVQVNLQTLKATEDLIIQHIEANPKLKQKFNALTSDNNTQVPDFLRRPDERIPEYLRAPIKFTESINMRDNQIQQFLSMSDEAISKYMTNGDKTLLADLKSKYNKAKTDYEVVSYVKTKSDAELNQILSSELDNIFKEVQDATMWGGIVKAIPYLQVKNAKLGHNFVSITKIESDKFKVAIGERELVFDNLNAARKYIETSPYVEPRTDYIDKNITSDPYVKYKDKLLQEVSGVTIKNNLLIGKILKSTDNPDLQKLLTKAQTLDKSGKITSENFDNILITVDKSGTLTINDLKLTMNDIKDPYVRSELNSHVQSLAFEQSIASKGAYYLANPSMAIGIPVETEFYKNAAQGYENGQTVSLDVEVQYIKYSTGFIPKLVYSYKGAPVDVPDEFLGVSPMSLAEAKTLVEQIKPR